MRGRLLAGSPWARRLQAVALLVICALALGGSSGSGWWEPHELDALERAARPAIVEACPQTLGLANGVARSFGPRVVALAAQGHDLGTLRNTLMLLAALGLLAAWGVAQRIGGRRAGAYAVVALLAMPSFALASRQLMGELATPVGGLLIIWGGLALATPLARGWTAVGERLLATLALGLGVGVGLLGGGALLGLMPPMAALAIYGWSGRKHARATGASTGRATLGLAVGSTLATGAALAASLIQAYDVVPPIPGGRELFGFSLRASECAGSWLGASWLEADNLAIRYASSLEQIGFGTLAVGLTGLFGIFAMLQARDAVPPRLATAPRLHGQLLIAWVGLAWLVTESFQRKAAPTTFAGYPALALGAGMWLAQLWDEATAEPPRRAGPGQPSWNLWALLLLLAIVVLGKDLQQFPDKLVGLFLRDGVAYPSATRLGGLKLRLWVMGLAMLTAVNLASALWWLEAGRTRLAQLALRLVMVSLAAWSLFWPLAWHRTLSREHSTAPLVAELNAHAPAGARRLAMGAAERATPYYTSQPFERASSLEVLRDALRQATPAFALMPTAELCAFHHAAAGLPYTLLARNQRTALITNQRNGTDDSNPLPTVLRRELPSSPISKPASPIVFDGRLELLGWQLPSVLHNGQRHKATLYWKVLAAMPANYKIFVHVDGFGMRFSGDHEPIGGLCAAPYWQPGDILVDEFELRAANGLPPGTYDVYVGWFTGAYPHWRNLPVSRAEGRTADERVKVTQLVMQGGGCQADTHTSLLPALLVGWRVRRRRRLASGLLRSEPLTP